MTIIEKIETRLKELKERKELLAKSESFKFNKMIEQQCLNARIDELNNLLND